MNPDLLVRWLWRLFLAIGVVILIAGAVMFVRTVRFVAEAEHATGTVVDLSREMDSQGAVSFIRSCASRQPRARRSSLSPPPAPLRRPRRPMIALRFSTTQTIHTMRN